MIVLNIDYWEPVKQSGYESRLWSQTDMGSVLLYYSHCVTSGESSDFSVPQSPHLKKQIYIKNKKRVSNNIHRHVLVLWHRAAVRTQDDVGQALRTVPAMQLSSSLHVKTQ